MILEDHWTCLMTGRSLKTTHKQQALRQACSDGLGVKSLLSYHRGLLLRPPSDLARDRRLPDHNLKHSPLPPYLISAARAQPLSRKASASKTSPRLDRLQRRPRSPGSLRTPLLRSRLDQAPKVGPKAIEALLRLAEAPATIFRSAPRI